MEFRAMKSINLDQNLLITTEELNELTQLKTQDLAGTKIVTNRQLKRTFKRKLLKQNSRDNRSSLVIFSVLIFIFAFSWFITTTDSSLTFWQWLLVYFNVTLKSTMVAQMAISAR